MEHLGHTSCRRWSVWDIHPVGDGASGTSVLSTMERLGHLSCLGPSGFGQSRHHALPLYCNTPVPVILKTQQRHETLFLKMLLALKDDKKKKVLVWGHGRLGDGRTCVHSSIFSSFWSNSSSGSTFQMLRKKNLTCHLSVAKLFT